MSDQGPLQASLRSARRVRSRLSGQCSLIVSYVFLVIYLSFSFQVVFTDIRLVLSHLNLKFCVLNRILKNFIDISANLVSGKPEH